ncbi:Jasmonate-zim-domain protein 3 [Abeliophyllum distichum]|uniref:Jasmonate-zim-domain protein 3 n=1 Tax=Abeliophyllum distichum TaxID=126358 RepID=A0ABD1RYC5_9LAMI
MSSILNSQGLAVVTAMAISAATIILFDHFRVKHLPENQDSTSDKQVLKSCLSLGGSKERVKMKKKRVQFADVAASGFPDLSSVNNYNSEQKLKMEISKYTRNIQKFSYCYSSSQTRFCKTDNIKIREVISEKRLFGCNFCPTPLTGSCRRRSSTVSVGCTVDRKDPKDLQQKITDGDIDIPRD